MNYTTKELADITNSTLIGDGSLQVNNISFDSRNIYSSAHTAFIAITTSKNSGEKYIVAAVEKGINVIISEHKTADLKNVTWIIVDDSLKFIQKLAQYHAAQFPELKTIGITGSNGKTIIKEWLYQSLSHEFSTVKSPKSFNSQLGLPLSLLQIEKDHEVGIFEVGISKPGEMEILKEIFSPELGALTHIGSAHSSNFQSEEEILDEKIKLFKNSTAIIFNGDNDLVFNKINKIYSSKNLISYGLHQRNDVTITNDPHQKAEPLKIR
ncbi:MAG: Mur ligase family protein, partial [Kaistella sp.]